MIFPDPSQACRITITVAGNRGYTSKPQGPLARPSAKSLGLDKSSWVEGLVPRIATGKRDRRRKSGTAPFDPKFWPLLLHRKLHSHYVLGWKSHVFEYKNMLVWEIIYVYFTSETLHLRRTNDCEVLGSYCKWNSNEIFLKCGYPQIIHLDRLFQFFSI